MPNASIKKIIPCKKNHLINMILDIEKYPEFVPWCISGKIHKKDDREDMIVMEADLTIGKKFLNQTYKSHVTYFKEKDNGFNRRSVGKSPYLQLSAKQDHRSPYQADIIQSSGFYAGEYPAND